MTRKILMAGALVMLAGLGSVAAQAPAPGEKPAARPAPGPGLTLTTTAFEDGGIIPNKYTMRRSGGGLAEADLDQRPRQHRELRA